MVREVIGADRGRTADRGNHAREPPSAASWRAPSGTAAEIWRLVVDDGVESGSVVPVGAVPAGMRGAT